MEIWLDVLVAFTPGNTAGRAGRRQVSYRAELRAWCAGAPCHVALEAAQ